MSRNVSRGKHCVLWPLSWGGGGVEVSRWAGSTVAAFIAMDSIADLVAKALYILASSETKDIPALP